MPRVVVQANSEEIRFQCQRCGSCCHHRRPNQFGELIKPEQLKDFCDCSNLIYLTNKDIDRIIQSTKLDVAHFVDTLYEYDGSCVKVEDSGKKIILDLPIMKSKEESTCVFYEKDCMIYLIRPRACHLFPFFVKEETTTEGDILLNISYNPYCPGIGMGSPIDKSRLEMLVVEQFLERAEAVAEEIQNLREKGRIAWEAQIFRSIPGLKSCVRT
ncbi:MAG: YkgJ family cysteine cluster protein [Methanotrichaceae archaeon]|nr:YkgJ family cysteine cluster protein [Methanotrichaceae archaeon]